MYTNDKYINKKIYTREKKYANLKNMRMKS